MKTVETGQVELTYFIRKEVRLPGTEHETVAFDWAVDGGPESDQWFGSEEEARKDVMNYFG